MNRRDKAWYEENVTSEWKFLEERATRDLLPEFDDDPNHVCRFDTSKVKALQEDRSAAWQRAEAAYKARIITRNQALIEQGNDPLPDGDPLGSEYFQTTMVQTSTSVQDDLDKPNTGEKSITTIEKTEPTDEELDVLDTWLMTQKKLDE